MCAQAIRLAAAIAGGDSYLEPVLAANLELTLTGRKLIAGATPVVTDAADSPLQWLYAALDFGAGDRIDAAQLSTGLRRLGELRPSLELS